MNKKQKNGYYNLIIYLILFLIFNNFPFRDVFKWRVLPNGPETAYAIDELVDATVTTTRNTQQRALNIVYVGGTTSTGYLFGVDSNSDCVYWKTTDGGIRWSDAVTIRSNLCAGTTVWYDRWTPGDTTGDFIHIIFATTTGLTSNTANGKAINYNRLNTANDTLLGNTPVTSTPGTYGITNPYSITKGTNGTLYVGVSDNTANGAFVFSCSSSCDVTANWAQAGDTRPMAGDNNENEIRLMPLASGNIMLINLDVSNDFIRSKVFTQGTATWDTSWTNISTSTDNTGFMKAFDVTINPSNNNLYMVFSNNPNNAANDLIAAIYNGTSWTTSTSSVTWPLSNSQANFPSIGYDSNDNTIIVSYIGVNAGSVFIKKSSDTMVTWTSAATLSTKISLGGSSVDIINSNQISIMYIDSTNGDLYSETITEFLIQDSWRWQDDDSPPNSNTNMAGVTTSVTNIYKGQRLTLRIQLENLSGILSTTTSYVLQSCTGAASGYACSTWENLGTSTAISTHASPSATANSNDAITAQTCGAPSGPTWTNGKWYEETATTTSFTLTKDQYTEFGFIISTNRATLGATYYFRLYNQTSLRTLESYLSYPFLTIVSTDSKKYSKDTRSGLITNNSDLTYYLDDLDYTRSSSSDNKYATNTAVAAMFPYFMFVESNSNSTDQISVTWEGQSSAACSAIKYLVLEAYNFTADGWQSKATSTDCVANTDTSLVASITSSISAYYNSNQTYWRVYKAESNTTLLTDNIAITFSAAGALSLSSPTSVTFNSYSLGGSGISSYLFATSTEQIIVTDSGLGQGWTLSGTCTNWVDTLALHTIDNGNLLFRSDGTLGTEPTIIFSNYSTAGVTEGTNNQDFNGSVTLVTAGDGNGVGIYYIQPSFDLYIYATSTYTGAYSSTLTITLVRNNETLPLA